MSLQHEINRAMGKCINGPIPVEYHKIKRVSRAHHRVEHGPPVSKGGKCQHCIDVHKGTDVPRERRRSKLDR